LRTSDFDYHLPESFIAQTPVEPRDSSSLLVLHRDSGEIEHSIFRQIVDFISPGDLLVLNQTRVIPGRLHARKVTGGRVELLLLHRRDELTWEALVGGNGLSAGKILEVEDGPRAEILSVLSGSERVVKFHEPIEPFLPRVGHVPLPPYIHDKLADPERYQTVYARETGSAAAPTAGLHFTPALLETLKNKGLLLAYVTLHVGLDTFAPVMEDDPRQHKIHTEWCELTEETADIINQTHTAGRRIIAVGTTSVRTLESASTGATAGIRSSNRRLSVKAFIGPTSLFILPGHQFEVVDAMITNFHLPKSTLLMLVSAFAGRERTLEAYEIAKRERYRFYSFGDAMLIL